LLEDAIRQHPRVREALDAMRLCSDFISDVTQTTAAVDKEVARNAENAQRSAEYERMTSTPRARGFFLPRQ
jgi:hypothetical protein